MGFSLSNPDYKPFIDTIRESADDEEDQKNCLIFADYLEDQGEPYAEFIRLGCGQHSSEDYKREKELLKEYRTEWIGKHVAERYASRNGLISLYWKNGLCREVGTYAKTYTDLSEELHQYQPLIRTANLHYAHRRVSELVRCPQIEELHELKLCHGITDEAVRSLVESERLKNLKKMHLDGSFQSLEWRDNQFELTENSVDEIAQGNFPHLEHLCMRHCIITVRSIQRLMESETVPKLHTFQMTRNPDASEMDAISNISISVQLGYGSVMDTDVLSIR